jgi:hypothetical protein
MFLAWFPHAPSLAQCDEDVTPLQALAADIDKF